MKSSKITRRISQRVTQVDIKQDLAVVKMIFEMYLAGFGAEKISEWVNDVKSSKVSEEKCDSKMVFDILMDESYKESNGLISSKSWDKVQELLCASRN